MAKDVIVTYLLIQVNTTEIYVKISLRSERIILLKYYYNDCLTTTII